MDQQSISNLKKLYDSFRTDLEKKIKEKKVSLYNIGTYYLIKESFINELNRICKKNYPSRTYGNYKNQYTTSSSTLSNESIEFINDISSVITCIKDRQNFKIVNKDFIESFYKNKYELRKNNNINYYTGNNKKIIEFKNSSEKNAILITNPLGYSKQIFFIEKKINDRDNKNLYNNLLSVEEDINIFISKNSDYKNIIKSSNEFINNINLSLKDNNQEIKKNYTRNNMQSRYGVNNSNTSSSTYSSSYKSPSSTRQKYLSLKDNNKNNNETNKINTYTETININEKKDNNVRQYNRFPNYFSQDKNRVKEDNIKEIKEEHNDIKTSSRDYKKSEKLEIEKPLFTKYRYTQNKFNRQKNENEESKRIENQLKEQIKELEANKRK